MFLFVSVSYLYFILILYFVSFFGRFCSISTRRVSLNQDRTMRSVSLCRFAGNPTKSDSKIFKMLYFYFIPYLLFCSIFWKILFHFHPKGAPLIKAAPCGLLFLYLLHIHLYTLRLYRRSLLCKSVVRFYIHVTSLVPWRNVHINLDSCQTVYDQ